MYINFKWTDLIRPILIFIYKMLLLMALFDLISN